MRILDCIREQIQKYLLEPSLVKFSKLWNILLGLLVDYSQVFVCQS